VPIRLAAPLVVVALAVALLAGCGGSSPDEGSMRTREQAPPSSPSTGPVGAAAQSCDTHAADVEGLRVTGVSCQLGRRVMYGWQRESSCSSPSSASRVACTTRSYRCLGARTDRGTAVSCARAGQSIAFIAKRG
jgi:hypothetical protein